MWPRLWHGVKLPFYALQSGSLAWVGEGEEKGVYLCRVRCVVRVEEVDAAVGLDKSVEGERGEEGNRTE